jgi:dienelactone hydrolase
MRATAVGFALACGCHPAPTPTPTPTSPFEDPRSFQELRAAFPTRLHTRGPSTGLYEDWPPPRGAQRIVYKSGDLSLWGWFSPAPDRAEPAPAVVYFHGAFSLTPDDFEATRRFTAAGFCVLTPTLRGENGNPGDLELLWGEVDDAVAAIDWLAARPEVDPTRVYAVGHSIGGAVAALVSLRPDAKVRLTGSVGGIYVPQTFVRWSNSDRNRALIRFDPSVAHEGELRTLPSNVTRMVHPHVAYIGDEDRWFHDNADAVAAAAAAEHAPFSTQRVAGDHMTSLGPGLDAFLLLIERDGGAPR